MTILLAVLAGWGCIRAEAAEFPVLNVDGPPGLSVSGRASYSDFLMMNLPRAMALGSRGAYGWFGGGGTPAEARTKAVQDCAAKGASDCTIYAENLQVVWHGAAPARLTPVPGPLIQTSTHAFVPDDRYFWRGPGVAAGAYVWGHGTGQFQDARGMQPHAHVRVFNNSGFDIIRFDRDPATDYADDAKRWLREGLRVLRRMGYRRIIVGGQSRGAWNALQALAIPGLADGVVAISPASLHPGVAYIQRAELYRMLDDANSPSTRVVVVQFAQDGFEGDPDQRARDIRGGLASHVGGLLLIDRPAGFQGHGAGANAKFAWEFGPCIYRFVMGQSAGCPVERTQ